MPSRRQLRKQKFVSLRSLNQTDKNLSKRLYEIRLERGFTQAEMGAMVGVTLQQWQKYERGINRISATRLTMLAEALKIPLTALVDTAATIIMPEGDDARADRWSIETLRIFRELSPELRGTVITLARKLLKQTKGSGDGGSAGAPVAAG